MNIMTVTGSVPIDQLGIILPHERVIMTLPGLAESIH